MEKTITQTTLKEMFDDGSILPGKVVVLYKDAAGTPTRFTKCASDDLAKTGGEYLFVKYIVPEKSEFNDPDYSILVKDNVPDALKKFSEEAIAPLAPAHVMDTLDEFSENRGEGFNYEYALPEQKKYPLFNKKHVESAIKLFNAGDLTSDERSTVAHKILGKMRSYGISTDVIGEDNKLKNYLKESVTESSAVVSPAPEKKTITASTANVVEESVLRKFIYNAKQHANDKQTLKALRYKRELADAAIGISYKNKNDEKTKKAMNDMKTSQLDAKQTMDKNRQNHANGIEKGTKENRKTFGFFHAIPYNRKLVNSMLDLDAIDNYDKVNPLGNGGLSQKAEQGNEYIRGTSEARRIAGEVAAIHQDHNKDAKAQKAAVEKAADSEFMAKQDNPMLDDVNANLTVPEKDRLLKAREQGKDTSDITKDNIKSGLTSKEYILNRREAQNKIHADDLSDEALTRMERNALAYEKDKEKRMKRKEDSDFAEAASSSKTPSKGSVALTESAKKNIRGRFMKKTAAKTEKEDGKDKDDIPFFLKKKGWKK